ncbi:MAG TPA: MGMT family protein, partial [Rhodothermales bacterium]|nr:MGMT family protein [Rhodothermales bacterium]
GKAKEQQPRNDFFERVWDVVAEIPVGKVTTYGHIAEHLGAKSAARTVGWAMNAAAGTGLPAHRVVNRFGALSGKIHFGGPHIMEDLLRSEGITFTEDGCVDMGKHLWVPGE